jgi:hypothetical protein
MLTLICSDISWRALLTLKTGVDKQQFAILPRSIGKELEAMRSVQEDGHRSGEIEREEPPQNDHR